MKGTLDYHPGPHVHTPYRIPAAVPIEDALLAAVQQQYHDHHSEEES